MPWQLPYRVMTITSKAVAMTVSWRVLSKAEMLVGPVAPACKALTSCALFVVIANANFTGGTGRARLSLCWWN